MGSAVHICTITNYNQESLRGQKSCVLVHVFHTLVGELVLIMKMIFEGAPVPIQTESVPEYMADTHDPQSLILAVRKCSSNKLKKQAMSIYDFVMLWVRLCNKFIMRMNNQIHWYR